MYEEVKDKKVYYPNLDGLRGVAILLVIAHHSLYQYLFLNNTVMGVALFFCISGFLICSLFLQEVDRTGCMHFTDFCVRRASRLFPLYYCVLALYCILIFGFHFYSSTNRELFAQKLPSYLFYYSNLLTIGALGPFFFAWSLAVEEQFYALFGLTFRFLEKKVIILTLLFLWLAKIVYFSSGAFFNPLPYSLELIIFSYREPILLGVLLAYLAHTSEGKRILIKCAHPLLVVGILAVWLLILWFHEFKDQTAIDTQLYFLLTAVLVGLSAMGPRAPVTENWVLSHLGKISYGVYLCHMLYINAIKKIVADPFMVFALAVGAAFVVNTLIYRYFEVPVMHKIRNIGKGGRPRRARLG